MTKEQKVLEHMQTIGPIDTLKANELYGASRLSAIILNLKEKGYVINKVTKKLKDRFGNEASYTEYSLADPELQPKSPDEQLKDVLKEMEGE